MMEFVTQRAFHESIALVGYRATGKSSVARRTAERLGWRYVDADRELEKRAVLSIQRIFAEKGEEYFRDLESEVLSDQVRGERIVLATGGGVILRESNRQRLREFGLVVWLRADEQTLVERLSRSPGGRPALTTQGLLAEVAPMLAIRNPLYEEVADEVIDTMGQHADEVADRVIEAWRKARTTRGEPTT
jgi:shikimate kinase